MPKVQTERVSSTKGKSTGKAKPKAETVAEKASSTKPKGKTSKSKAAEAAVTGKEPKTVTLTLPAGARRVQGGELPDILKGVPGLTVKETIVFDVPVSLGGVTHKNPANVGADNGPKGSLGWTLGNAHAKINGEWAVGDTEVAKLKAALAPLMDRVLTGNGESNANGGKISLPEGFRDSLPGLEAERKKAGLPLHADKNYYPVQVQMRDGRTWEAAVHPSDLNGGGASTSSFSPDRAMKLGRQLEGITNANNVPRNISRADVEGAAATLRAGVADVTERVKGTRGNQVGFGGETISAGNLAALADAMELLALKMKQAGI